MEKKKRRPNILWICTDQQRYDTLSCYGNDFVNTPNLDKLSENGFLFEKCYSQNPVCTPSRASFLTGRYPSTTRCRQNGQMIPDGEVLITKYLQEAGYTCGLSGKLHLAPCHPDVCSGTEKRIDDGYNHFHWSHHPAPEWPTNEYIQWLEGKGKEYKTTPYQDSQYIEEGMLEEDHHTTWCVEKAVDFIKGFESSDDSWLFSLNIFDPHHPFDPPREYLDRYLDDFENIPLPNYRVGELEDKPVWQETDHQGAYGGVGGFPYEDMSDSDHRLIKAAYWAMVDLIDKQVGRLLQILEETEQLEDTIIIFTSDHGEMLGDHGIYLKGPYFYESAVRVPLIISWPGHIESGVRTKSLVELVDLAPTLLDACGLEMVPGMQGKSFWDLISGVQVRDNHREDVYSEFYASNFEYEPEANAAMVCTDQYKLVFPFNINNGELYDLKDGNENENLWDNPEYEKIRFEMMQRLLNRMAGTVDPLPVRQSMW